MGKKILISVLSAMWGAFLTGSIIGVINGIGEFGVGLVFCALCFIFAIAMVIQDIWNK